MRGVGSLASRVDRVLVHRPSHPLDEPVLDHQLGQADPNPMLVTHRQIRLGAGQLQPPLLAHALHDWDDKPAYGHQLEP